VRLSDVVSHMNLAFWPQVALVIFMFVFFAVTARVYTRPRGAYQRFCSLPLEDSAADPSKESPTHG
jgi:hypothetical protein